MNVILLSDFAAVICCLSRIESFNGLRSFIIFDRFRALLTLLKATSQTCMVGIRDGTPLSKGLKI